MSRLTSRVGLSYVFVVCLIVMCLQPQVEIFAQNAQPDTIPAFAKGIIDGLAPGVSIVEDSVILSEETIRLMTDAEYRTERYPEYYALNAIPQLLEDGDFKMAVWYLINIHAQDAVSSRVIVYELAKSGITSQFYLNAFYTYVLADPEIIGFDANTPYVADPIALEQKLEACKELAAYANYFFLKTRDQNGPKSPVSRN